jgi:hypothetical protein
MNVLSAVGNLPALSYEDLAVDITDSSGSLFIAGSLVAGYPDVSVQLSPIQCFIASESVNRLGTGVHIHVSETCLIWKPWLISSVTFELFLIMEKFIVLPRKQQSEMLYVSGMYLANLWGLLGEDEHQVSAYLEATYPTHGVILQLSSANAVGSTIISVAIVFPKDDVVATHLNFNAD